MTLPTEPVGSVPRYPELQFISQQFAVGEIDRDQMDPAFDETVENTVYRFEKTGSSDGEQVKSSFATWSWMVLKIWRPTA